MKRDTSRPLALVMGGGGARAAYQIGVLSGIAEKAGGDVPFPIVTGVSAGAINAASVAARGGSLARVTERMARAWLQLSVERVFNPGHFALGRSAAKWIWALATGVQLPKLELRGVLDTKPLHRTLTHFFKLEGIGTNLRRGRLRAIGITATSYASGRTVTFVQGEHDFAPWRRAGRHAVPASIGLDHILASSALPLLFPAVRLGAEYYGDGGLRQTAPLAPAIHLGASRVLAISLRQRRRDVEPPPEPDPRYPVPAQILGMLLNSIFLDAVDADAERMERVNRSVRLLPPGTAHPDGLRKIDLVAIRPSRDLGGLAADLADNLPPALRTVLRGIGATRLKNADFLSYLLFERPYIERLIELGRADAFAQWDRIGPLIEDEGGDRSHTATVQSAS